MTREEAAEFTRKLLARAEINAFPGKPKRINNIPVFYFEAVLSALRGPQPVPITGLVPCGCGGKAYFEKTSDDLYPSKVTCSNCHMSTDYTSDDDRSRRDWNRAMGHKGGAE